MIGKLSLILTIVLILHFPKNEEEVYIIVDDCKNWEVRTYGNKSHFFINKKQRMNNPSITLGHGWIEPTSKRLTKNLTLSQTHEKNPIYTSNLDDNDWIRLIQNPNQKFFVLRPDEYCSDKRFLFNQQFSVYEVKIFVGYKED